jgi:hypothetical protein
MNKIVKKYISSLFLDKNLQSKFKKEYSSEEYDSMNLIQLKNECELEYMNMIGVYSNRKQFFKYLSLLLILISLLAIILNIQTLLIYTSILLLITTFQIFRWENITKLTYNCYKMSLQIIDADIKKRYNFIKN